VTKIPIEKVRMQFRIVPKIVQTSVESEEESSNGGEYGANNTGSRLSRMKVAGLHLEC